MQSKSLVFAVLSIAVVAGSATYFAPVAQAGVNLNVDIGIPPPAPRYEPVPVARDGYIWIQGYWGWDGVRHVWYGGHWEPERRGYIYVPAHWDRVGDHWRYREGHWDRAHRDHRDHYDR